MNIALIACSKRKLSRAAPARELYQGTLFKYSLSYVEEIIKPDLVFVLSARYYVVPIDKTLFPYDQTLIGEPAEKVRQWGTLVRTHLEILGITDPIQHRWTLLAGKIYRKGLYWLRGIPCYVPLEGRGGIGKQVAWLQHRLGAVCPRPRERESCSNPHRP